MTSVVIVDYKTPGESFKYIGRFVEAVTAGDDLHYVVVDNSGTDDIRTYCEDQSIEMEHVDSDAYDVYTVTVGRTTVHVVDAHGNLGYARGNNLGVRFSNDMWHDRRVIISNNDVYFPRHIDLDSFEQVLRERPDVAVVGPMVRSMDDAIQQSPRSMMTFSKWVFRYWMFGIAPRFALRIGDAVTTERSQYVYWVTGCFMYVDAEKFNQVGMFDPNTFLYWEEKILSERLARHGYRMYFTTGVTIHHQMGNTISNAVATLRSAKFNYDSAIYYFTTYRHINKLQRLIASLSFHFYTGVFPIRQKIKGAIRQNK